MISDKDFAVFEMWFREYFDVDGPEELPDPKYLHLWADLHGQEFLSELKAMRKVPICPGCCHPRCDSRCDLNANPVYRYIPGEPCPCCVFKSEP